MAINNYKEKDQKKLQGAKNFIGLEPQICHSMIKDL